MSIASRLLSGIAVFAWAAMLAAQTPAPSTPEFEAASVKPNPSRTGIRGHSFPGDRFEARNVPLRDLIMIAYGQPGEMLPESHVIGPNWIDEDRFDVSATAGASRSSGVADKQLMVRALLATRFKFLAHVEPRNQPVYLLTIARKDGALGPQLHHAAVDCEALLASQPGRRERCILAIVPSGQLMLRGQTMSAFANALTRILDRAVIDRTGLSGGFDADAEFNPEGLPGMAQPPRDQRPQSDAPALETALRERLGLKLDSTRGRVDILVVDHVERPTDD